MHSPTITVAHYAIADKLLGVLFFDLNLFPYINTINILYAKQYFDK